MVLDGKVALITGASRGIGADMAYWMGRAGAAVAVAARTEQVTDPRLPGTIHTVAKAIRAAGGRALPVRLDVRDPDSIIAAVDTTVAEFGRLDIVVNNAAILVPGTLETVQPRHLDLIWQIDLRAPLLVSRAAIPHLRAAGGGHIINISSPAAISPGPGPYEEGRRAGSPFYGMVKAALERVSLAMAVELQAAGIAVNVLSPHGRIRTPGNIWAQNNPTNPTLDFEAADEMGAAAVWICEQPPRALTGHTFYDDALCREQGLNVG